MNDACCSVFFGRKDSTATERRLQVGQVHPNVLHNVLHYVQYAQLLDAFEVNCPKVRLQLSDTFSVQRTATEPVVNRIKRRL